MYARTLQYPGDILPQSQYSQWSFRRLSDHTYTASRYISLYKARKSARELFVDTVSYSAPVADGRQGLFMRCHATRPNSERVLPTGDKLDGTVDRHLGR